MSAYLGLFASAFVAATLLPFASEAVAGTFTARAPFMTGFGTARGGMGKTYRKRIHLARLLFFISAIDRMPLSFRTKIYPRYVELPLSHTGLAMGSMPVLA